MSVYTKTGDGGETSLLTGERVEKASLRVDAYGTVDELNSALAMARAFCEAAHVQEEILELQKLNMLLMADLASKEPAKYIGEEQIAKLEASIDAVETQLPPLTAFIVPGKTKGGAALDLARTIARRAERRTWELVRAEGIDESLALVLNRLSDFCFVLMRLEEV